MVGQIESWEKDLIRKIQQENAFVDFETGEVRTIPGEFTNTDGTPLGYLRKKLIPGRKKHNKCKIQESQNISNHEYILTVAEVENQLITAMDSGFKPAMNLLEKFIEGDLSEEILLKTHSDLKNLFNEAIPELNKYIQSAPVMTETHVIHLQALDRELNLMKNFCDTYMR